MAMTDDILRHYHLGTWEETCDRCGAGDKRLGSKGFTEEEVPKIKESLLQVTPYLLDNDFGVYSCSDHECHPDPDIRAMTRRDVFIWANRELNISIPEGCANCSPEYLCSECIYGVKLTA